MTVTVIRNLAYRAVLLGFSLRFLSLPRARRLLKHSIHDAPEGLGRLRGAQAHSKRSFLVWHNSLSAQAPLKQGAYSKTPTIRRLFPEVNYYHRFEQSLPTTFDHSPIVFFGIASILIANFQAGKNSARRKAWTYPSRLRTSRG